MDYTYKELIQGKNTKAPVQISARHFHVTADDFYYLFGKKNPTKFKELGQNQFAAKETVELVYKKKTIQKVRLVAPFREKTQVEISMTEAIQLGIHPVIRISGDLKDTPGITIKGPKNSLKLKEGVIVAQRHIHVNPKEAEKLNVKHKDKICVMIKGRRTVMLGNVVVRVAPESDICVHLDSDEGNAAGIPRQSTGYLFVETKNK